MTKKHSSWNPVDFLLQFKLNLRFNLTTCTNSLKIPLDASLLKCKMTLEESGVFYCHEIHSYFLFHILLLFNSTFNLCLHAKLNQSDILPSYQNLILAIIVDVCGRHFFQSENCLIIIPNLQNNHQPFNVPHLGVYIVNCEV